jgi:hypothetical protein
MQKKFKYYFELLPGRFKDAKPNGRTKCEFFIKHPNKPARISGGNDETSIQKPASL